MVIIVVMTMAMDIMVIPIAAIMIMNIPIDIPNIVTGMATVIGDEINEQGE
jgi:hypothetical protein